LFIYNIWLTITFFKHSLEDFLCFGKSSQLSLCPFLIKILNGQIRCFIRNCAFFLIPTCRRTINGVSLVGIVIPWKSLFLCAVSGIVITVLAGNIPGYLASKFPPIVAYKQSEPSLDKYSFLVRWLSPILLIASIAVSIFNYLYMKGPEWVYLLTGLCFLLSVFMGIPVILYLTVKFISFISKPFLGSEALLAGRNALRQMRKNMQIAGILMLAFVIGLTGYLLFFFHSDSS
jgi:putative ABC transport system permease protein